MKKVVLLFLAVAVCVGAGMVQAVQAETIDTNALIKFTDDISLRIPFKEMEAGTAVDIWRGKISIIGITPILKAYSFNVNFGVLTSGQADGTPAFTLGYDWALVLPQTVFSSLNLQAFLCRYTTDDKWGAGISINYAIPVSWIVLKQ